MSLAHILQDIKEIISSNYRDKDWMNLWETDLIPNGLPLVLGLGMSVVLAILIVGENWALIFALLLLIPAAILFLSYPFSSILLWILLMPFLQTTVTTDLRMVYWLIHRVLPVCALSLAILSNMLRLNKNRRPVRLGIAEFVMLLFLGIGVVNILYFQSDPMPYFYWLYDRVFIPVCLFLIIRFVAPGEKDLERLLPVAFLIVIFETSVTILSILYPGILPNEWLRLGGSRGIGTFNNPYTYSLSLVLFSFLLFHGAMQRKSDIVHYLYLMGFGVGVLGMFFSFSRGTWLGAIMAFMGLFVLYPRGFIRIMSILLLILIILGSTLLADQVDWATRRLNAEDSALDRGVIWDAGLQMIQTKPLFGWGYGDYSLYAWQFQRRVLNYVASNPHASHNALLTVAAEMGLPALILFLVPQLWYLWLSFKTWSHIPKVGLWSLRLFIIFWLSLLDYFIVTMFTDISHSTYSQGLWWITLGFIATMVYEFWFESKLETSEVIGTAT